MGKDENEMKQMEEEEKKTEKTQEERRGKERGRKGGREQKRQEGEAELGAPHTGEWTWVVEIFLRWLDHHKTKV